MIFLVLVLLFSYNVYLAYWAPDRCPVLYPVTVSHTQTPQGEKVSTPPHPTIDRNNL